MQLPSDILLKINYDFSRCHHPELLDWQLVRDTWTATMDDRKFVRIPEDRRGPGRAEAKSITMGVGIDR